MYERLDSIEKKLGEIEKEEKQQTEMLLKLMEYLEKEVVVFNLNE